MSPLSKEVNEEVGHELGKIASQLKISLMASASMRAHDGAMSADNDLTAGFVRCADCEAVHFKGTNAVRLHGNLWRIPHGTSYVLQEEAMDFSNHAKEACLMAYCANQASIALCANGGPTVACNVARFLGLCRPHKVFTLCGLHAASGLSGAAASFMLSAEQLEDSFRSLVSLAPAFFSGQVKTDATEIEGVLRDKPLRLLGVSAELGCEEHQYVLRPGGANPTKFPGMTPSDEPLISTYAAAVASVIAAEARPERLQQLTSSMGPTTLMSSPTQQSGRRFPLLNPWAGAEPQSLGLEAIVPGTKLR